MLKWYEPGFTRRQFLAGASCAAGAALLPGISFAQTQPSDRPLGWALVGLGNLAINELMPALTKTQSAKLVGLVSGHPDKANKLAQKYSVDPRHIYNYDNYDKIKDDPDIDVIYIVLPNGMHAEYTIRAANAGKHVFSEKPMANTADDCQKMIDACRDAKRLLGIGYRMQYEPHLVEARRMIKEGAIGKVKAVKSEFGFGIGDPTQWRLNKKLAGGGPMMDVGIYCLNSTRFALGAEPVEVSATIPDANGDPRFKEVEPAMDFSLTFPNGVVAECKTSYRDFVGNRLRIEGENGNIHLEPAFSYGGIMMGVQHPGQRPETISPKVGDQFAAEIEDFSRCIIEGRAPKTPGEEGWRDMKIIEALYHSAADKKPVKL
jgi:predicted dehydrogenase